MDKYSVLMSLYHKEKPQYLDMAIESMIKQTLPADEIVIVKDGEITDELQRVLDKYVDIYPGLFKIIGYENNRGLGLALNYGLEYCKNELVARMDTDDYSKPERCEKQVLRFLENPSLAIVGSHIDEFIGDVTNVVSRRCVPLTTEKIFEYAKRRSAFNHPTVMYRKSKVIEQGGYSDLKRNQDVDLFGRMLFAGNKAENIDESLLWFRSSDELALRRKSWVNTQTYIATIHKFWKMGYSSFADFCIVAMAQTIMYIMPVRVQDYLYRHFLRK